MLGAVFVIIIQLKTGPKFGFGKGAFRTSMEGSNRRILRGPTRSYGACYGYRHAHHFFAAYGLSEAKAAFIYIAEISIIRGSF